MFFWGAPGGNKLMGGIVRALIIAGALGQVMPWDAVWAVMGGFFILLSVIMTAAGNSKKAPAKPWVTSQPMPAHMRPGNVTAREAAMAAGLTFQAFNDLPDAVRQRLTAEFKKTRQGGDHAVSGDH